MRLSIHLDRRRLKEYKASVFFLLSHRPRLVLSRLVISPLLPHSTRPTLHNEVSTLLDDRPHAGLCPPVSTHGCCRP